ncbi:MAG: right-handed parallel beta-helix repeat-containing protein [Acidobacteria bacterium]|nr:right-handed parallel beta-helix repeat-containing protein [Acidobacteriota bacterium]
MSAKITRTVVGLLIAISGLFCATQPALGQDAHTHTAPLSGVPQGVPYFCANPSVTSATGGAWSDPETWSPQRVPGVDDKVRIEAGHDVVYDVASDVRLDCIEVNGRLRFSTDASTHMRIVNLTVMDDGVLEVGTEAQPVARDAMAEIIIADQATDDGLDPAQIGTGIQGLGTVRMHGAVKPTTFLRLAAEPLAGQTTLLLEDEPAGWAAGDEVVIPDTRQLRERDRRAGFVSRDERLRVRSVAGNRVTLEAALQFDHVGARTPEGTLEFLPHVGNLTRNVLIRSENPEGTRGHTIFMARADVDIRYVAVQGMGRTKMGPLDNTMFDGDGHMIHAGENQIGRYAIHFHHYFGPTTTPEDGYQFQLIGNAVDEAPKWGVTIHNSHYGLVRDNVVYNTGGAGIATEDGNEAFNVFEHNFAMRIAGSGDFAPRSGYGGPTPDPGGEGAGLWFRGPHNYIRNNVAANADAVGFGLAAGGLGSIRIPAFKGADPTLQSETVELDTTASGVLEFTNNEAYGAIQAGAVWGWNGEVTNFRVWHPSRHGVTATPTDKLVVDRLTVRGDTSVLVSDLDAPVGLWFSNYAAKSVVVTDADIQGLRVGVASPFYPNQARLEPGRGDGSVVIENGYFRNHIGVVVATGYASDSELARAAKRSVVRNATFESLDLPGRSSYAPAAVSMNYRMAPGDTEPRDPIEIVGFNGRSGDDFKVYYSLDAPPDVSPCHETQPDITGWVCR